jgi:SpoVK/Ycf46/Vps4 family AAA+-type ATPase
MDCQLFEVASEDDDGDPITGERRLRAFRAAQSFFAGRRVLIVFDEAEDVFSGGIGLPGFFGAFVKGAAQTNKAWVNRSLEQNAVPTLWLSNSIRRLDPAFVRRFDMLFELPVPPKKQRQRIVQQACGNLLDAAGVARMAEVATLAPAVVTRAASVVQAVSSHLGASFDAAQKAQALMHLIGNTLQAQGHAGLRQHDPNRLPELYDPAFIHADADLAQVADGIRRSRTGRLCLYGPPGTGKTAYGRWLAEQLDAPLLVKRVSDLQSMWVGEAEKNIARAFREAEREGAVLLIDEVDSFLQDRRGAQRSWEVTQVNEMLTQMESFPGVFIASTNLMSGLDQAALRRFDLKVKFDFLTPGQAVELMRRHCDALGLAVPDATAQQAVRNLRNLTPGDFAAALRQNRFRAIATAAQLAEVLRGECAVKEGARPAIGFVH